MKAMFKGASEFKKDLTNWKDEVKIDVNTQYMFAGSGITTMPNWKKADGTRVCFDPTNHENIATGKKDLQDKINDLITATSNPSPDLNYLETCNVKDMSKLFENKTSFNGDISEWDVSNVTDMSYMFYNAKAFNKSLSSWDVSKVTDMSYMFYNADAFNQNIKDWDVSKVTDMSYMFHFADAFDQDIKDWM